MRISLGTEEGKEIVNQSRALLEPMKGALLSFQTLCGALRIEDQRRAAEIAEFLCTRDVRLLRHVYFFLDDNDIPMQLHSEAVLHYVRSGEFFHPRSHELMDPEVAEDHIVIEFEVVL